MRNWLNWALEPVVGKVMNRYAVKTHKGNGNLSPRDSRMFKLTEMEGLKGSMD